MSGLETADGRLDEARLGSALLELESGTIDPVERDELMALVARSPAAQRAYLEHFEMTAMLEAEAATHAEAGLLPVLPRAARAARMFQRSLLAAAAVVAVAAVVATWIKVARPVVPELAVTATATSQWLVDGENPVTERQRAMLRQGATVRVESGTLELRHDSGATMILQGPAEVSFPKLTQPVARAGWLWIDSGHSGEVFEVRTPGLRIRNLGTRFGIKVPAEGPTEVHLIQGKLAVTRDRQHGTPMKLGAEERAWAIPPDGEATSLPLARDPFPGISGLLDAHASYSTTILSQSPSNYWRINDGGTSILANEVPGGVLGGRHPRVAIREGGLSPAKGFHGFDADNRAALLPGTAGQGALSLGATPVHQGELFRYDFSGGKNNLHGAVIPTALGETQWAASTVFNRDGSLNRGRGSATLAFAPVDGVVYTLDASVRDITGSDSWIGLGFARGQSGGADSAARFVSGHIVEGRAWMLARGDNSRFPNMAHTLGNGDPASWTGALANANGGDLDLRIILDTTAGAGHWTAAWFAKHPADARYVEVRERSALPNELISSVGFAVAGENLTGRIAGFSLHADQVPRQTAPLDQANGPVSVRRREGAVSFWIRRDQQEARREVVWTAGEDPSDDSVQLRLEADGCVGFFMENGRYDVLITSEESLADGRWHHLVTSWDNDSVDLYLDGRRVASDAEFRAIQHGILRELRFGCGPAGSGTAPFAGGIDEIAVWDRALTAPEVERQFHSARGR